MNGSSETTPFVGRETELDALMGAFGRAATESRVELVTILAEPGMGKSRLVREFEALVAGGPGTGVITRKGRCLPYGDGVSFWALGEIVRAHAGILETDDQVTIGTKLDATLTEPDAEIRHWLTVRLAPLVGLETTAAPPGTQETFAAWTQFLTSMAAQRPAVLFFEDVHWADDALLEFLVQLADAADRVPLMIVATARPEMAERPAAWLERASKSTLIRLVSLDDDAVRTMVKGRLAEAPDELIERVVERSAGSPLYAEQFAALAGERGLTDEIPATIRDLLSARIEALPNDLRLALMDASVIGRVFWSGAVASIEGQERVAVQPTLEALATRELTRARLPSSMADESEYSFWHALLRDVAYSFLSDRERLSKHLAAAEWIRKLAGGQSGSQAEIVADHLRRAMDLAAETAAEDELPAIRSDLADALVGAADHSMRMDPGRAVGQLRGTLDLLEPADSRRASVLTALGGALIFRSQYAEAATVFDAAVAAHRDAGDEVAAATLSVLYARCLINAGNIAKAAAVIEEARPILEASPGQGLVDLYVYDVIDKANGGNNDATISAANAALEMAEKLGLPQPHRALEMRGLARIGAQDVGGATDVRDAIDLALAAGDNRSVIVSLANWAMRMDRMSDSITMYDEAIAFAARHGMADDSIRAMRLDSLDEAGRWDEALAAVPSLLDAALARGDAYTALMVRMVRAGIEVARGGRIDGLDDLVSDAVAIGFRSFVMCGLLVNDAYLRGDYDLARRRVVEGLDAVGDGEYITAVPIIVDVCVLMDDLELAHRVLAKSRPGLLDGGDRGTSDVAIGFVLEAEGNVESALPRFEVSQAYFAQNDWAHYECLALLGMGTCAIAMGSRDDGLRSLRRAREVASYLKVPRYLERIDAAISAGG